MLLYSFRSKTLNLLLASLLCITVTSNSYCMRKQSNKKPTPKEQLIGAAFTIGFCIFIYLLAALSEYFERKYRDRRRRRPQNIDERNEEIFRRYQEQIIKEEIVKEEKIGQVIYKRKKQERRKPITITRKPETEIKNEQDERECPLCTNDEHKQDFYKLKCGHEFCNNCLCDAIELTINENKGTGDSKHLRCPECTKKINNYDIKQIVGDYYAKVSRRLADIQTREYMEKQPGYRHCKTPDCEFFYLNNDTRREKITCHQCGKRFCSNCCHPHSMRMTCEHAKKIRDAQSKISEKERKANEEWLKKHTKPCPQCKFPIERNGGCRHITCQKCKHEFCWVCLKKYRWNKNVPKGTSGYCDGGMTGCPDLIRS